MSKGLKKIVAFLSIILLIVSVFSRCAKIVSPSGGPRDSIAPIMVRSNPAINALNFKGEKVTLTFNEYIVLKDIQKKFVISPPMAKKPEIVQRGKSIDINFNEPLKENTTYTLYFADAIVDNNEGNAIKNFEFAFSTGNYIDSLTLTGKILNSYTLLPEEDAYIMLYDKKDDSVSIKEFPRYISRANKMGLFTFKNLKDTTFKIFALKDNNSNYKFDQVTEDIAFQKKFIQREELVKPSLLDTSRAAKRDINLFMFKEKSLIQARTGFSRSQRRKLALAFTKKPEGEVTITPLNANEGNNWFIQETNPAQDSLIYWITNDVISALDTIKAQVRYLKTDSLKQLKPQLDTLRFAFKEEEKRVTRKRKDDKTEEVKKVYLKVGCSIKNTQIVKPTKSSEFIFPLPLKHFNEDSILITNLKDSSRQAGIKLFKDSINPRIYRFNYKWTPDIIYKLEALPGAFIAIDGTENDSLEIKFKGANPEGFGILNITLMNVKKLAIVELLNEKKSQVIDRKVVKPNEKISFTFVDPGKYTLRFIEDLNMNGVWDTGWYLKGIQPEKLYYFDDIKTKGIINIRANWENDITFDFGI